MDLFQENVIVTANDFNITLVTQMWLINNGIVREEEFAVGPNLFTPAFVQVATPHFNLLVIQNQLQYLPIGDEANKQDIISNRLARFVSVLPHTPYTAVGLNFTWHYTPPENVTVKDIGRRLFFKADTPFARSFDSNDAKFGAYYSKNVPPFRLKLAANAIDITRPNQPVEERIQLAFNYHLDSQNVTEIVNAMQRWSEIKQHSSSLVDEFEASL